VVADEEDLALSPEINSIIENARATARKLI
jgi:hypothetical protein